MRAIWCTPNRSDEADLIASINQIGVTIIRRCIEASDLLAAASIDEDSMLVVDAVAPRLSTDTINNLPNRKGRLVIVIVDNEESLVKARSWGVDFVIDTRQWPETETLTERLADAIAECIRRHESQATPASPRPTADAAETEEPGRPSGQVVVVCGTHGAPGRSTIALGLAEAWAEGGERTCLIDADTVAPALATMVGMTEDVSGLLVAARYADQGALDGRSLGSACRRLTDSLWLMSGIGTPDRWDQARVGALDRVWSQCALHFDRIVIDTSGLLHAHEVDDPFHGAGIQRDAATLSALRASDHVVAVTRPDAVGLLRLLVDLPVMTSMIEHSSLDVVVNRLSRRERSSVAQVERTLRNAGYTTPVHGVADDDILRTCSSRGALLAEVAGARKVRKTLSRVSRATAA